MSFEAAVYPGVGQDEGFAKEGPAFRTADIKDVGQAAEISQRQVIPVSPQAITHAGAIDEEVHVILAADFRNSRQFSFCIECAVFRRKRDIDQRRPRQVFGFAGIIVSLHFPFDLVRRNLAVMMGQGDDFVACIFNGRTFMAVDMARVGTDDAVTGTEEG